MTKPKPKAKAKKPTREVVLARALALFQKRGVDATTMRDIAAAAGLSLGAAYYYFPSKEALVFAFYEQNQVDMERLVPTGTLREQLGAILHAKLAGIRPHREMLGTIIHRLVDATDPLSAFSAQSAAVRDRGIAVFARALADAAQPPLPPEVAALAARGLWVLMLGTMLVFVNDASPDQVKTHALVDETLDLITPLAPLLASPLGRGLADRIAGTLARAGLWSTDTP